MIRSLFTLVVFGVSATWLPAANVNWLENFEAAQQAASELNQPLLIHFYAKWCVPCKRLDRIVFSEKAFAESIKGNYVPLKVDLDLHPQLAKRFGVTSVPADVVLTPSGEVLANERSPSSVEGYTQALAKLRAKRETPTTRTTTIISPSLANEKSETREPSSFFAESLGERMAGPIAAKPKGLQAR